RGSGPAPARRPPAQRTTPHPRPPGGSRPARRAVRTSSMREEHGGPVALHPDIEAESAAAAPGDERTVLRRRAAVEVDPRQLMAQQAAGEDVAVEGGHAG